MTEVGRAGGPPILEPSEGGTLLKGQVRKVDYPPGVSVGAPKGDGGEKGAKGLSTGELYGEGRTDGLFSSWGREKTRRGEVPSDKVLARQCRLTGKHHAREDGGWRKKGAAMALSRERRKKDRRKQKRIVKELLKSEEDHADHLWTRHPRTETCKRGSGQRRKEKDGKRSSGEFEKKTQPRGPPTPEDPSKEAGPLENPLSLRKQQAQRPIQKLPRRGKNTSPTPAL